MKILRLTRALVLSAFLASGSAAAFGDTIADASLAPPGSSSDAGTGEELARLQAQIPVLTAKAAVAELNARIWKAEHADAQSGGPSLATVAPSSAVSSVSGTGSHLGGGGAQDPGSLSLQSVSAYNGRYSAVLSVAGVAVPVQVGDQVADGWKVARITDTSVELARGRESRTVR
jgi:type IV pilus biogenesis protein PilP